MCCWLVMQKINILCRVWIRLRYSPMSAIRTANLDFEGGRQPHQKKKQIISPQKQNGRVTVNNSHTNLFWNNFSAAKIHMPFGKSTFCWSLTAELLLLFINYFHLLLTDRPFSSKKSNDSCLVSLSLRQRWEEYTVWRAEILSLVGEKCKYKSYKNMW